jgi:hypothetical protein
MAPVNIFGCLLVLVQYFFDCRTPTAAPSTPPSTCLTSTPTTPWSRSSGTRSVDKNFDPGRTRTCNPQIRSLVPYPLGHKALASIDFVEYYYTFFYFYSTINIVIYFYHAKEGNNYVFLYY